MDQEITLADLEREVGAVKPAKKLNIPIAPVYEADDYEQRNPGGYVPPVSYIRQVKKAESSRLIAGDAEASERVDYVLERTDEVTDDARVRVDALSPRAHNSLHS